MKKKLLSLLLVVMMVMTSLPATAFAAGAGQDAGAAGAEQAAATMPTALSTDEQLIHDEALRVLKGENVDFNNMTTDISWPFNNYGSRVFKESSELPGVYVANVMIEQGKIKYLGSFGEKPYSIHLSRLDSSPAVEFYKKGIYIKPQAQEEKSTIKVEIISNGPPAKKVEEFQVEYTIKSTSPEPNPQGDVLASITEDAIFDGVKGSNIDKNNVTSDLAFPNGANPFYANVTEGNVTWNGTQNEESKVKVEIKGSDSALLTLEAGGMKLVKRPEMDTTVNITAAATEIANPTNTKTVTVPVTVKAESPVEKELRGYLNKYLVPQNGEYTMIKKEGVNFANDYSSGNVRYRFTLPKVTTLAGLPDGSVKANITTDATEKDIVKVNNYIWLPVRNDVGGGSKTVTLNYTLTKDGVSVTKPFKVTIPALTKEEIDEEIRLLEQIKANFAEGLKGKNFDANNISSSLIAFREVQFDNKGKLYWNTSIEDTQKYYGFKLTTGEGYDVTYPEGGEAVLSGSTLVLEKRPASDVKAVISHNVESFLLQRYVELYPQNKELQKIKKQSVSGTVIIKKIDATAKSIEVGSKKFVVGEAEKDFVLLTDTTIDKIKVNVELGNKSATLVINGNDCTNVHSVDVPLVNGHAKININVSDKDGKADNSAATTVTNNYSVTVVSKAYLEEQIKSLPDDPKTATEPQKTLADELLKQYNSLSNSDKNTIVGKEKLEKYTISTDPLQISKAQVEKVCQKLFEGIKGQNLSSDCVYTDMNEVNYAHVDGEKITWSKKADNSNVKIEWKTSSAPTYINVVSGTSFGDRYVEAFKINQRPERNSSDMPVEFTATVTHLVDSQVTKEAKVNFTLKKYNANLKALTLKEFVDFKFDAEKSMYTVLNSKAIKSVNIDAEAVIPGAKITLNGQPFDKTANIALNDDVTVVKFEINDGISNTLNQKWDYKEYTISIIKSVAALKAEIEALPDATTIDKTNYTKYEAKVNSLSESYKALSQPQKDQIGAAAAKKLEDVRAKISQAALDVAKENAIAELEAYQNNKSDYTDANWQKVLDAKAQAKKAINNAGSKQQVLEALTAAKAEIYKIPRKDVGESAKDTSIREISVIPGNYKASKLADGSYQVTVAGSVDKVRVRAVGNNPKANIKLEGKDLTPEADFTSGEVFAINKGGKVELSLVVTSSDGSATNTYKLVINRLADVEANTMAVGFELIGDSKHGDGPHVADQTWIAATQVNVASGATVKDLTDKMLIDNGISFVTKNNGTYISSINGLAEFDNGQGSGWIYSVNGAYPNVPYSDYKLKAGDKVCWKYTDNYKTESGLEGWEDPNKKPVTQDVAGVAGGAGGAGAGNSVDAKVPAATLDKLVADAAKNKATSIELNVKGADKADKVSVEMPKDAVLNVANKTDADLKVNTPAGSVIFDRKAMTEAASKATGSDLTVVVEKKAATDKQKKKFGEDVVFSNVDLLSGGVKVKSLGDGTVKVSLPITDKVANQKSAVAIIGKKGKLTKVAGKVVAEKDKKFFQFETSTFGKFVLAEEAKIDGIVAAQVKREEVKLIKTELKTVKTKAPAVKTVKNKVVVKIKLNKSQKATVKKFESMGYDVKYKFYRSKYKNKKFKGFAVSDKARYVGKAGKAKYFYKTRILVYDKDGKLVAKSGLK